MFLIEIEMTARSVLRSTRQTILHHRAERQRQRFFGSAHDTDLVDLVQQSHVLFCQS